jgi:hypothetical protein
MRNALRRGRLGASSFDEMKQIYKITYPTGTIYVGKDSVGSSRYFCSPDIDLVNADFRNLLADQQLDYTVRKQILWESQDATEAELSTKEVEMILAHRSNAPHIGYNRWPKFNPDRHARGSNYAKRHFIPSPMRMPTRFARSHPHDG